MKFSFLILSSCFYLFAIKATYHEPIGGLGVTKEVAMVSLLDSIPFEDAMIDSISHLRKVIATHEYIFKQTGPDNLLQYSIWSKPSKQKPYYWVKVMEDNGSTLYTHFNFFVKKEPFLIFIYDAVADSLIDIRSW